MNKELQILRLVIREEIGRSLRTTNNDPYSYEDYPGINVEIYPTGLGSEYHMRVTCDFNNDLSTNIEVYTSEEEARSAARKHVEEIQRSVFGQNIEL